MQVLPILNLHCWSLFDLNVSLCLSDLGLSLEVDLALDSVIIQLLKQWGLFFHPRICGLHLDSPAVILVCVLDIISLALDILYQVRKQLGILFASHSGRVVPNHFRGSPPSLRPFPGLRELVHISVCTPGRGNVSGFLFDCRPSRRDIPPSLEGDFVQSIYFDGWFESQRRGVPRDYGVEIGLEVLDVAGSVPEGWPLQGFPLYFHRSSIGFEGGCISVGGGVVSLLLAE